MPIGPPPPPIKSAGFDTWLTNFRLKTAYAVPPAVKKDSDRFGEWIFRFYEASGKSLAPPPKDMNGMDDWMFRMWSAS